MIEFKAGQRVIWRQQTDEDTDKQALIGVVVQTTEHGVVIQVRHADGSLLDHTVEPEALARAPQPWDSAQL